jgi:hypothetical protein
MEMIGATMEELCFLAWSVPRGYEREEGLERSQSVKRRLGGWREMAASLGVSQRSIVQSL